MTSSRSVIAAALLSATCELQQLVKINSWSTYQCHSVCSFHIMCTTTGRMYCVTVAVQHGFVHAIAFMTREHNADISIHGVVVVWL